MSDPTNDADCITDAQAACATLQGCLRWWEDNHPSVEVTTLHGLLSRLAARFEGITGAQEGSLSNPNPSPNDGVPKQ